MEKVPEQKPKTGSTRGADVEDRDSTRLPVQLNLFTGKPELGHAPRNGENGARKTASMEGISLVRSGDKAQLVIHEEGIFLGKMSDRLTVKVQAGSHHAVQELPFFELSEVIIASGGVAFDSDLIEELCRRGIPVHFMQLAGRPDSVVPSHAPMPALSATSPTLSEEADVMILAEAQIFKACRSLRAAKAANQAGLLRYFADALEHSDAERFEKLIRIADQIKRVGNRIKALKADSVEKTRSVLGELESTMGCLYQDGVREIIIEKMTSMGHAAEGTVEVVQPLLQYGYGILYTQVWGAVMLAGLEPFAGILHGNRPGNPPLVLDLLEEFREAVVDRAIFSSLHPGGAFGLEAGTPDVQTRKYITDMILERLESQESYEGRKRQLRSIIRSQATHMAGFLKGSRDYKPCRFKWPAG